MKTCQEIQRGIIRSLGSIAQFQATQDPSFFLVHPADFSRLKRASTAPILPPRQGVQAFVEEHLQADIAQRCRQDIQVQWNGRVYASDQRVILGLQGLNNVSLHKDRLAV